MPKVGANIKCWLFTAKRRLSGCLRLKTRTPRNRISEFFCVLISHSKSVFPKPISIICLRKHLAFFAIVSGARKTIFRFLQQKQTIDPWLGVSTKSYTKTSNYTRVESKWPNYQWRVQVGHGSQTLSSFQLLQSFLTFTKSLPLPHHNGLEESGHSSGRASLMFSLGSL